MSTTCASAVVPWGVGLCWRSTQQEGREAGIPTGLPEAVACVTLFLSLQLRVRHSKESCCCTGHCTPQANRWLVCEILMLLYNRKNSYFEVSYEYDILVI